MTAYAYALAEMLIRRPTAEVFEAFIDPAITSKFWFTHSTGRLDQHKDVVWTWEMYNHSTEVKVMSITTNQRIEILWGEAHEHSHVVWTFTDHPLGTFVSITNDGLKGEGEDLMALVRDATEGFTLVLAGVKALLEHGIHLNLVADRYPK
ncbi:SRPBCC family protein [Vitreoscilla massiliensis]|uniref:SRPBCC family protein n=1 Tax=Vitreoscilla massiliensis TaxID=1689272 RepID=A0ABY4E777_9NEIS|nr:SRPBCC family protein [Vitreoscilla massiliensis]UOO89232.1 SRPBCC family protein [Vitreoscilla massiliensis]